MQMLAIGLLLLVLFFFYYYLLQWLAYRPAKLRRQRLAQVFQESRLAEEATGLDIAKPNSRKQILWFQKLSRSVTESETFQSRTGKLTEQLRRADIHMTPQEWLLLCAGLFLLPIVVCFLLDRAAFGFLLGAVFACCPPLYVRIKIRRRTRTFNRQLNDMLTIMSNSLKSGYSFLQTAQMIASDMPSPISDEFERLMREIRMGLPTEEALQNLNVRVQSEDFDLIVTAIIIQRQIGGNLAEILDNIGETIRERVRIQGEIRSLTAQGRFSALIFMVLPSAIGVLLYSINPDYVGQLFRQPIGLAMIAVAVVGQLIGAMVIKKIVAIEV